jgi:hypothetical protein
VVVPFQMPSRSMHDTSRTGDKVEVFRVGFEARANGPQNETVEDVPVSVP